MDLDPNPSTHSGMKSKKLIILVIFLLLLIGLVGIIFLTNKQKSISTSSESSKSATSSANDQTDPIQNQTISEEPQANQTSQVNPPSTVNPQPTQPPPPPPQPPPAAVVNKTVTISINSSGDYSSYNLSINRGDTVKWVNNDNTNHEPASDPHPQHTLYPGFDSNGIGPGGSWSFVFSNSGSWGWHDHLFPSKKGTITVS